MRRAGLQTRQPANSCSSSCKRFANWVTTNATKSADLAKTDVGDLERTVAARPAPPPQSEPVRRTFRRLIVPQTTPPQRTLDHALDVLDQMIGPDPVKEEVAHGGARSGAH